METQVQPRTWHIRWWASKGAGPICNGLRQGSQWDECQNLIKKVGLLNRGNVVGIAVQAHRLVYGPALLWFCLSNVCFRFPSKKVTDCPPVPTNLPVMVGTSVSEAEVTYLFQKGLSFGGLQPSVSPPQLPSGGLSLLDLRIDVNCYPEKLNFQDPNKRLRSRNGKKCNSRHALSECHRTKIALSRSTWLTILEQDIIEVGNCWGFRLHVWNEASDSQYWV